MDMALALGTMMMMKNCLQASELCREGSEVERSCLARAKRGSRESSRKGGSWSAAKRPTKMIPLDGRRETQARGLRRAQEEQ